MELLCINDKVIVISSTEYVNGERGGVKEGKIYETQGEVFSDKFGNDCYYIKNKGTFLAMRFTKALPRDVLYEYTSIKTQEPVLN